MSNIPRPSSRLARMRALDQSRMSTTPSAGSNLSSCSDISTTKVTMKTTVAVRDDTPHRFQLVPLREVETRLANTKSGTPPKPSTPRNNVFLDIAESSPELSRQRVAPKVPKKENAHLPVSKSLLLPAGTNSSGGPTPSDSSTPTVLAEKDPNANDKRARRYITTENLGSAWQLHLMFLDGALTSSSTASTVSSYRRPYTSASTTLSKPGSTAAQNTLLSTTSTVSDLMATYTAKRNQDGSNECLTPPALPVLNSDTPPLTAFTTRTAIVTNEPQATSGPTTPTVHTATSSPPISASNTAPSATFINWSTGVQDVAPPFDLAPVLPLRLDRLPRTKASTQSRIQCLTRPQTPRYFLALPSPEKITRSRSVSSSLNLSSCERTTSLDRPEKQETDNSPSITEEVISELGLGLSEQFCEMLLEEMTQTDCDENEDQFRRDEPLAKSIRRPPMKRIQRRSSAESNERFSILSTATTNGSNTAETDIEVTQDCDVKLTVVPDNDVCNTSVSTLDSAVSSGDTAMTSFNSQEITIFTDGNTSEKVTSTRARPPGIHRNRKRPSTTSFAELEYYTTAHMDFNPCLNALSQNLNDVNIRALKRKYREGDDVNDDNSSHRNEIQGPNHDEKSDKEDISNRFNGPSNLGLSVKKEKINVIRGTQTSRPPGTPGNLARISQGRVGAHDDEGLQSTLSHTTHGLLDAQQPRKRYAIYTRSLQIPTSSLHGLDVVTSTDLEVTRSPTTTGPRGEWRNTVRRTEGAALMRRNTNTATGCVTGLPRAYATASAGATLSPVISRSTTSVTTATSVLNSHHHPVNLKSGAQSISNPHSQAPMFKAVSSRLTNPYLNLYPQSVASFPAAPKAFPYSTPAAQPPQPPLPPPAFSTTPPLNQVLGANAYAPPQAPARVPPLPQSHSQNVYPGAYNTLNQNVSSTAPQIHTQLQGQPPLPRNQSFSQSQPHHQLQQQQQQRIRDSGRGDEGERRSVLLSASDLPASLRPGGGMGGGVGLGLTRTSSDGSVLGLARPVTDLKKDQAGVGLYDSADGMEADFELPPYEAPIEQGYGVGVGKRPTSTVSLSRSATPTRRGASTRAEKTRERLNQSVVQPQTQTQVPQPPISHLRAPSEHKRTPSSSTTDEEFFDAHSDEPELEKSGVPPGVRAVQSQQEQALDLNQQVPASQNDDEEDPDAYMKWAPKQLPYHSIVLDLFAQLDIAISEWDGIQFQVV